MKPIHALTLLFLTLVLSACGLIADIIGEREINDPFNVDNQEVAIMLMDEGTTSGLAVQATGQTGTSSAFADRDFDLRGFNGDYIRSEVGLEQTVQVSLPITGSFPASFTVTDMRAAVMLSDEGGPGSTARQVTMESDLASELTLVKDAGCTAPSTSCTYTYDGNANLDLAKAFVLELGVAPGTDDELQEALEIIQLADENTPNTATITFMVTTDSTPDLAGSTLTFTLREGKSVVKLKG